jgi:O-antigen ligase
MPHMIVLRNIDIVLIFIASIINFINNKKIFFNFQKYEKIIFVSLGLFVSWAFIISLFSEFRNYCFHELKAFINLGLLGSSAFFIINSNIEYKKVFLIIFGILMVFPIYHTLYSFHYYLLYHKLPFRSYGLTVGLDELNFMMPYILTFFSVEIVFRVLNKKSFFPVSNTVIGLLLIVILFSLYVQAKRNGIVSVVFMILSIMFFINIISDKISKKIIIFSFIGFVIGGSLLFFNIKEDKRWEKLSLAYNVVFIKHDMSFLKKKLPYGLDDSNYKRLIYFREGIKLILKNPVGYGYGRTIFGRELSKEYHIHSRTHAHSGMIDWGIELGVIGLIFWSVFIFVLIYIGFINFIKHESYFGLFIVYLSVSFYFRMFLDSINKDHMLQQFIFFVFLGFFAIYREKNE